jgi:small-conductance mechanosensitive channel
MNRSLVILLGTLALAMVVFGSSYAVSRQVGESCLTQPGNDLAWLRQEFHLNDAEMARVQKLHSDYLPQCADMCQKIAAKKMEVVAALNGATNVTPAARQKLAELAALRAQCQAQMLRHFTEVSQAMPPEQGRRYLADMQRITLGLHEPTEQSMSISAGDLHGHH